MFYSARSVQKVSQILCFFKKYLLIHEYLFYPLQSNPHQILYTCANVFSNPRSTSKNHFLWSCSAPPSMPTDYWSWLVRQLPSGWLTFCFHIITINPWFVTSYDPLEQIWVGADRVQQLLRNVNAMLFCLNVRLNIKLNWWWIFSITNCVQTNDKHYI